MKKSFYRLSSVVMALTLLMSGYSSVGTESFVVSATTLTPSATTVMTYVTKQDVEMKAGKHKKNKTLIKLPKGKAVTHVKSYGSWTQVKYGAKTGYVPTISLGNKKTIKIKSPSEMTLAEKDKIMKSVFKKTSGDNNGGQYSMTHHVKKTDDTLELGGAGMNLDKDNGLLALDVMNFNSAYGRTDDFGKEAQEELKLVYSKYTAGFRVFSTVTIGANNASTLQKEFEKFAWDSGSGTKTVTKTIGGKIVVFKKVSPEYYIEVK